MAKFQDDERDVTEDDRLTRRFTEQAAVRLANLARKRITPAQAAAVKRLLAALDADEQKKGGA